MSLYRFLFLHHTLIFPHAHVRGTQLVPRSTCDSILLSCVMFFSLLSPTCGLQIDHARGTLQGELDERLGRKNFSHHASTPANKQAELRPLLLGIIEELTRPDPKDSATIVIDRESVGRCGNSAFTFLALWIAATMLATLL